MRARSIKEEEFEQEVLHNPKVVLVDFWAEWCGPCRALGPVLDQVAESLQETVDIVKVNLDEAPELALRYQVATLPTLKIFRAGQVVGTLHGAKPRLVIEQELSAFTV